RPFQIPHLPTADGRQNLILVSHSRFQEPEADRYVRSLKPGQPTLTKVATLCRVRSRHHRDVLSTLRNSRGESRQLAYRAIHIGFSALPSPPYTRLGTCSSGFVHCHYDVENVFLLD